jgi:hypothetical protein
MNPAMRDSVTRKVLKAINPGLFLRYGVFAYHDPCWCPDNKIVLNFIAKG